MRVRRCAWSAGVEERTACLAPKRRWARASWNTELACLALAPDGLPPGPAPGHARGYAAKAPGKACGAGDDVQAGERSCRRREAGWNGDDGARIGTSRGTTWRQPRTAPSIDCRLKMRRAVFGGRTGSQAPRETDCSFFKHRPHRQQTVGRLAFVHRLIHRFDG